MGVGKDAIAVAQVLTFPTLKTVVIFLSHLVS